MKKRPKYLHREDRAIAVKFIDYVRLGLAENVVLEILARHLARHLGINPDMSNSRIANRIAAMFERRAIV